jgi:hypothetical protein
MVTVSPAESDGTSVERLVSADVVGNHFGTHGEWWLRRARQGLCKSYKLGRHVRFRLSECAAYIEAESESRR